MSNIFVSGLVNIETNLKISNFPINYSPIEYLFNGISSTVSGVGYNVSKAFATLGDEVHMHTLIGNDHFGKIIVDEFVKSQIGIEGVYHFLDGTPQSVIAYDDNGNRKIFCDLKNIQEVSYPAAFAYDMKYDLAVLTNVNFSREFFSKFRLSKTPIATDCHVLKDINSEYDKEFLENANIIFLSNEAIKGNEESFLRELIKAYEQEIIVIAMGSQGSLLYDRLADDIYHQEAITVRPIVNTVGAGDALFSAFLHFYIAGYEPIDALKLATYFAGYKIGDNGGAEGFLKEHELFSLRSSKTGF